MPRPTTGRQTLVADAAIAVLAEAGMRGLTHRAVDAAAGLPPGSTSYYARTRAALLEAVVSRLAERSLGSDGLPPPPPRTPRQLADLVVDGLWHQLTSPELTLARYEITLEARRRPELRAALERGGAGLREIAASWLTAAGSAEPQRHARMLVAWCEGVLFDRLAGAGATMPATRKELTASALDLLTGMILLREAQPHHE